MSRGVLPFITIVMPVRNEADYIQNTLDQLLTQDYPEDRFEIIVADGDSTDQTIEIVKKISGTHPQVLLLSNPGRLSSSGRNVGFKHGKGEIFAVVDGHCYIPDNRYLSTIAFCFEKSGADCLGRSQPLDPPGLSPFQKAVALARASRVGHSGDSFIYSNFEGYVNPVSNGFAYKREVFKKVGYVDERFDACEDVDFNYRIEKAGLRCYMSPALMVKYYPRENIKGLFKQMSRYGQGRYKFIRKHPETLSLNQVIPALFFLGILLILALEGLVFIYPPLTLRHFSLIPLRGLIFIYCTYLVGIILVSIDLGRRKGKSYFQFLPLIFFIIHIGVGHGLLKEAFFNAIRLRNNSFKKII